MARKQGTEWEEAEEKGYKLVDSYEETINSIMNFYIEF